MKTFKKNMHPVDRLIRVVAGIALIWLGFVETGLITNQIVAWFVGAFGVMNLISASLAFCPPYWLAGISTLPGND